MAVTILDKKLEYRVDRMSKLAAEPRIGCALRLRYMSVGIVEQKPVIKTKTLCKIWRRRR